MHYLLTTYNDFVDRRRGSIPGDDFHSSGVLLDPDTRDILSSKAAVSEEIFVSQPHTYKCITLVHTCNATRYLLQCLGL